MGHGTVRWPRRGHCPRRSHALCAHTARSRNDRLKRGDVAGAVALLEVAAPALEAVGDYSAAWARQVLEYARQELQAAQPEPEPA